MDKYLDYGIESPGNDVFVEGTAIEAGGGGDCFYYSLGNRCRFLGIPECSKSPKDLRLEIGSYME